MWCIGIHPWTQMDYSAVRMMSLDDGSSRFGMFTAGDSILENIKYIK